MLAERPVSAAATFHLPAYERLQYVTTCLELFFLVLALPYVIGRLLRNPEDAIERVGRGHLG